MERSGPTPSALRRVSLPGGSGTGGAPTAAAESHLFWTGAGTYIRAGLYRFVLYSFRQRASEGAQLDGEFAFYASRRRLRAWRRAAQLDGPPDGMGKAGAFTV